MGDPERVASAERAVLRGMVLPVVVGLVAFAAVIVARISGILDGWLIVLVAAIAAVAIPTSREASRRVLIAGCVVLGWLPLTWWFPLPLGSMDRLSILTAAIVGGLAASISAGRTSARTLMPRFRIADVWTFGAGAYAAWMVAPLFAIADGQTALRALRLGWDYASHFDMTESIRRTGSIVGTMLPGPLGAPSFSDYPKGFHAAAATVMEAIAGRSIDGHGEELVGFTYAVGALAIVTVMTVAAGISSLPQLRRRPLLALALVGLVTLAFTTGPGGGSLLQYGFPNFLVAVGLLACVPLLVIPMNRIGAPAPLLAVSGAVVGIAHNWALLLAVAVAGLAAVLMPARRRRWPTSARGWAIIAGIGAATVAGGLAAWTTLVEESVETATVTRFLVDGGFVGGSRAEFLLPPVIALGLCLLVGWTALRRGGGVARGEVVRTAAQALVPATGLILMAWMAALHYAEAGRLLYYFQKLAAGVQLASVVLAAAAIAVLVSESAAARRRASTEPRAVGPRMALGASLVALVALGTTSSGFVDASSEGVSVRRPPGYDARAAWQQELADPTPRSVTAAREILLAAGVVTADDRHFWVPASLDRSTAPRLSNQWMFALTGQWSRPSYEVVNDLWGDDVSKADRPSDPTVAIERLQAAVPDSVIVVPPGLEGRARLHDDLSSSRIVTW